MDVWKRLRAWTVGRAKSRRIAWSSASFHARATECWACASEAKHSMARISSRLPRRREGRIHIAHATRGDILGTSNKTLRERCARDVAQRWHGVLSGDAGQNAKLLLQRALTFLVAPFSRYNPSDCDGRCHPEQRSKRTEGEPLNEIDTSKLPHSNLM